MKISVCLATYNGEKYIKEQLYSILPQLNTSDEIIISDDNSTDTTLEVIKKIIDPRIKVFINKGVKGYSKNFENAINNAQGDILFVCDQDDVWMPNKVEIMTKALVSHSLAMHNALIVDGDLNPIHQSHFELYNVKKGFVNNFLKTRYIGACMAFRKEILQKALPFPENQELCAYDYWLTLIAEYYYSVNLIETPLILYRRHGNNASTGGSGSKNTFSQKIKVRFYSLNQLLRR